MQQIRPVSEMIAQSVFLAGDRDHLIVGIFRGNRTRNGSQPDPWIETSAVTNENPSASRNWELIFGFFDTVKPLKQVRFFRNKGPSAARWATWQGAIKSVFQSRLYSKINGLRGKHGKLVMNGHSPFHGGAPALSKFVNGRTRTARWKLSAPLQVGA